MKIKDGVDADFVEIHSIIGRNKDIKWLEEHFIFEVKQSELSVRYFKYSVFTVIKNLFYNNLDKANFFKKK